MNYRQITENSCPADGVNPRLRWLGVLLSGVLLLLGVVPVSADGSRVDWWLVRFEAGDQPVKLFVDLVNPASARSVDGEPVVVGFGYGGYWVRSDGLGGWIDEGPSGDVLVEELGGDGLLVSSTGELGGLSFGVERPDLPGGQQTAWVRVDGQRMGPGGVVYILQFWAHGSLQPTPVEWWTEYGEVSFAQWFGTGSGTVRVADPSNEGVGIGVGVSVVGSVAASRVLDTGIAGGLPYCDHCDGIWRTPDGREGVWKARRSVPGDASIAGGYVDNEWFAGPAGSWRWTWEGRDSLGAGKVIAAYAPVGDAWPAFTCPDYQSDPGSCGSSAAHLL